MCLIFFWSQTIWGLSDFGSINVLDKLWGYPLSYVHMYVGPRDLDDTSAIESKPKK